MVCGVVVFVVVLKKQTLSEQRRGNETMRSKPDTANQIGSGYSSKIELYDGFLSVCVSKGKK